MDEKDANRAEDLAEVARRSYKMAVDRAFAARESNVRIARSFFEDWVDMLEAQADINRYTLRSLADVAWEQQETFLKLSRESLHAYNSFLDSLYDSYEEASKKQEPEE